MPVTDSLVQPTSSGIPYHMNWFPVEYEGALAWDDHSDWTTDDEYSMNVYRPDQALETGGRSGVHIEFNSTETVDNFDNATSTWWYYFHHSVVDSKNQDQIKAYIKSLGDPNTAGPFAIVIGMLGLDLAHVDHHAELHPAYGIFIRQKITATQDKWAFFIRNWGVEGLCGPNNEPIPQTTLRVRLQHKKTANFVVTPNVFSYAHDGGNRGKCAQNNWSFQSTSDGLLLTFGLSEASNKCGFVGDLVVDWKLPDDQNLQVKLAQQPPPPPGDNEGPSGALRAKLAKLTPTARAQLDKQIASLTDQATAVKKPPAGASSSSVQKAPTGLPNYGKGLKSTPDASSQALETKKQQLVDAFLKSHGIQ